jgi:transcriptional regulator with XRE-family HTH domain
MENFPEWIEKQLVQRDWRPSDLARVAGIADATLSRILNETRKAGPETCVAIARALRIPPERVFRKARLLPPLIAGDDDDSIQEMIEILRRLPAPERLDLLEYMEYRYQRYERKREEEKKLARNQFTS